MFFRVLLVGFSLFGPGVVRALRLIIYSLSIFIIKEVTKLFII